MAKDFYENYRSLHEEINRAYEVVKYHPSSILANEIAEIEKTIDSIDLIGNLEGSVGESFNNVKNSFVLNIRAVKESVQGSFAEADSLYIDLKVLLETLKINNDNYKILVSREPQEENYKETITYIDNLGKQQTNTTINRVAYNRDHQLWEGKISEFETNFVALTDKINAAKNDLDSINNNPFSLKNTNINLPSLPNNAEITQIFANLATLPLTSQKEAILRLGWGDGNPFEMRYSQGDKSLSFAGGSLNTTGCGGVSFAYGVSCALSREYNCGINITPQRFLPYLYKSNGSSSTTYGSNGYSWTSALPEDITHSFSDITIVELESNNDGVFDEETMRKAINSGGIVVGSLKGASHIVCIYDVDENSGTFSVNDPGFKGNENVSFGTTLKRGDTRGGTIACKKAWIIYPNNCITTSPNNVTLGNLDANDFPEINAIYTSGSRYEISSVNSDGSLNIEGWNPEGVSI